METLKQIVTIPENHQLHLDITLPEGFPTGPAEILLVFASKSDISLEESSVKELGKLAGTLKNSPHFGGDPLTIQKALRDEWQK